MPNTTQTLPLRLSGSNPKRFSIHCAAGSIAGGAVFVRVLVGSLPEWQRAVVKPELQGIMSAAQPALYMEVRELYSKVAWLQVECPSGVTVTDFRADYENY